jgi:ribonuclease Z
VLWVIKKICSGIRKGKYKGDCNIFASDITINAIRTIRDLVLSQKNILPQIKFIAVENNETRNICGMEVKFFDTKAEKAKQFGFSINNNKIVFCGDEPLIKENFSKFNNCGWLLHNAYCLDKDEEKYNPHSMSHSTVQDAAQNAATINAKNLVMWHTEMDTLSTRKEEYMKNARQYFSGNIFVPNDLDIIKIN